MSNTPTRLSWTLAFNWGVLVLTILVTVGQMLLDSPLVQDVPPFALWVTRIVAMCNLALRYTTSTATAGILSAKGR